jgi:ribosomal-protein-alanine N-acetyltransferase
MTDSNLIQFPQAAKANVRAAVLADLPKMKEIAAHSPMAAQWSPKEYEKLFADEYPQNRRALVIERAGGVVGFIVGRQITEPKAGGEWEIENIVITVPAQRGGLGSHLLREFLKLVHERTGQAIYLEVRESNLAARALYRKWTFLETGRRKNYYENPPEDALILRFIFP